VFCQFSTVQQDDPVTHKHTKTYMLKKKKKKERKAA